MKRTCLAVACALLVLASTARIDAYGFDGSAVVMRDGNPTLLVDGRPFFFFGAAFFYERIATAQWRPAMLALRAMGFNTLDLYVPWNWHEPFDGDFDFNGRTNPRRNLRRVLALARELDFKLLVRPGPVIRNEWRNGGYPAWLLTRPAYGMPLHDVLEGRYPATATLQNAHSDDAAAQWLANATHMRYARRWLRTVLHEFRPVADRVIGVQLDDDQGAYIDNQTWPAPHLHAYLGSLEATVRGVVGSRVPVFINTYEMKVTASAPVWAMGNWYQSDTYAIGEHDRASLEFSTGLLQTQTRYPVAMSEFQAGWLAAPEDPQPRPADPTNTTLALHTFLQFGARGVVVFPAQDTMNPAGWEAPFANAAYAWDAALDVNLVPSARYAPTRRFGDLVRRFGAELADSHRLADGAIAYLTSAYDPRTLANADVFAIAARTQQAQVGCRVRRLTCDLVDLRFADDRMLRRYPFLIVPANPAGRSLVGSVRARLARYRAGGGRVVAQPPVVAAPSAGAIPNASVLVSRDGAAFVDVVNYDPIVRRLAPRRIVLPDGRHVTVGPLTIAPRAAVLVRLGDAGPLGQASPWPSFATARRAAQGSADRLSATPLASAGARLVVDDRAADGYPRVTLQNAFAGVTIAPAAGARAFAFFSPLESRAPTSVFTSVGGLRDDVAIQPPLSTTDRIGKYTRTFPAGMFNRPYQVTRRAIGSDTVSITLTYAAPDVVPAGARFTRTLTQRVDEPGFTVTEHVVFGRGVRANAQRAVRYDSFDTRRATLLDERARGAVGFFYPAAGRLAIIAWSRSEVEDARITRERSSAVVRLQFARGQSRTRYLLVRAATPAQALATLAALSR